MSFYTEFYNLFVCIICIFVSYKIFVVITVHNKNYYIKVTTTYIHTFQDFDVIIKLRNLHIRQCGIPQYLCKTKELSEQVHPFFWC